MRLGIREYLRNIWFNIASVIILTVLVISTVILISVLEKETRIYRFMKPYMGEKGVLTGLPDDVCGSAIDRLEGVKEILTSTEIRVVDSENHRYFDTYVYDSREEEYLELIMKEGVWISEVEDEEACLVVVISENPYGIKAGDRLQLKIELNNFVDTKEIDIFVCGVIADGQQVHNGRFPWFGGMSFQDIFSMVSYEQQGDVIMITSKSQLSKLPKDIYICNHYDVIKFSDTLSEEAFKNNINILDNCYMAVSGASFYDGLADSAYKLKEISKKTKILNRAVLYNYIPLIIMNILLVSICIVGIVALKVVWSKGYYAKLYICGMKWRYGVLMSQFEIGWNCVFSALLSLAGIMFLQKEKFNRLVFVEIGNVQILCWIGIYIVIMSVSGLVTGKIIKHSTAVEVLKEVGE